MGKEMWNVPVSPCAAFQPIGPQTVLNRSKPEKCPRVNLIYSNSPSGFAHKSLLLLVAQLSMLFSLRQKRDEWCRILNSVHSVHSPGPCILPVLKLQGGCFPGPGSEAGVFWLLRFTLVHAVHTERVTGIWHCQELVARLWELKAQRDDWSPQACFSLQSWTTRPGAAANSSAWCWCPGWTAAMGFDLFFRAECAH